MIRVVIADDQELFCQSLKIVLNVNPDMEVVDTVGDGGAAVESVARHRPDVVLMDIRMPVMDGLELLREIKALRPECRVVMISAYADFEYAKMAMKLGAEEYLLKPISETINGTACLTSMPSSVSQCATICLRRFCMIKTTAVTINIVTGINIKMQSPRIVVMSCRLMTQ